jgi:hypothetical protein
MWGLAARLDQTFLDGSIRDLTRRQRLSNGPQDLKGGLVVRHVFAFSSTAVSLI